MRTVLARLTWCTVHPECGVHGLPAGWMHGRFEERTIIACRSMVADVAHAFEALQTGDVAPFCNWVRAGMPLQSHLFDRASVDADLEWLGELIAGEVD